MNWNNITVKQYQQLFPVVMDESLTNLDRLVEIVSIVEGIPTDEIDGWEYMKILDKGREYQFLEQFAFDKTAKQYIDTPNGRYQFVWEVERMPVARYIEAKTFGVGNIIPNLHKVMASCVLPMRKNWYGKWKPVKYDARKHSEYATDLQDAKFTDVYNCVVFFYPLFDKLMESFLPYSINLMNQQIDRFLEERLQKTTDGSTILSGSLSSSGLP